MKVGDRVRCVDNRNNEEFYSVGAEGIVDHIDRDGDIWVSFDLGEYDQASDGIWCGKPESFAQATPVHIKTIHIIADELRTMPARRFTKARLVELGEMIEAACKGLENAGKTE